MRSGSLNRGLPTVLLLLAVVVIVPTAGVLWFMTVAVRNERAAVRETLTAAYRAQLLGLQQQLQANWARKHAVLGSIDASRPPAEVFAELVRSGVADSVVLYGDDGSLRYPGDDASRSVSTPVESGTWLDAQRLEFSASDYDAAAAAYGQIARREADSDFAARALRAQARCLAKAGSKEAAVAILTQPLAGTRFAGAVDGQGRLIAPNGWLLALRLIDDTTGPEYAAVAELLESRLEDYGAPPMPSAQRRFLMRQFQELVPARPPPDTLAAEDLATRYLEAGRPDEPGTGIDRSGMAGIWQLVAAGGRVVALYVEDTVQAELASLARASVPAGVEIELQAPDAHASSRPALLSLAAGGDLPGWRLTLHLTDRQAFDSAADAQAAAYLWTGVLLIAFIAVLAYVIARMIGRQIRLTQLKNDLIATVSHELKTPLASMRLLVDTLLDGDEHDAGQAREYLELISRENARLSRLIEDFLTFSRMERNKQTFATRRVPPAAITTAAADAVSAQFRSSRCRFDVDIEPDLPSVIADPDAMATAIVNLLDNAYKYSKEDKDIALRAYAEKGHVCFAVEDNGIGLSRRAAKRVFDRFYQVDQSLARDGGGVGLGLSIVMFIVDAHNGEVSVTSKPGAGSTFTVRLPQARVGTGARDGGGVHAS